MSIAPNATEERPQALGRVFRHEFARALAYLRLGAIPAYIVAYFGIRRVFRVTGVRAGGLVAVSDTLGRWWPSVIGARA